MSLEPSLRNRFRVDRRASDRRPARAAAPAVDAAGPGRVLARPVDVTDDGAMTEDGTGVGDTGSAGVPGEAELELIEGPTLEFGPVPLMEVAEVDRGRAYTSITRRDGRRTITVTGNDLSAVASPFASDDTVDRSALYEAANRP